MNMNIYITKENEFFLKSHSGSMSGLINDLLNEHRRIVKGAMYKPDPSVLITTPPVSKIPTSPIIKTKADAQKVIKPLIKDTSWGGPLFRDKKKSKL